MGSPPVWIRVVIHRAAHDSNRCGGTSPEWPNGNNRTGSARKSRCHLPVGTGPLPLHCTRGNASGAGWRRVAKGGGQQPWYTARHVDPGARDRRPDETDVTSATSAGRDRTPGASSVNCPCRGRRRGPRRSGRPRPRTRAPAGARRRPGRPGADVANRSSMASSQVRPRIGEPTGGGGGRRDHDEHIVVIV